MKNYLVQKFIPNREIYSFDVPASKSIANRAILLAALSDKTVSFSTGNFGEDTLALLGCLSSLGIRFERDEQTLRVYGCNGAIPNRNARLDVKSAGTAARFLPAVLSFIGGEYYMDASEQMRRRPMDGLAALENAGVQIEYLKDRGKYPFILRSNGISPDRVCVGTDVSTQFLSGLLIAGVCGQSSVVIHPEGERGSGSYVKMTLRILRDFGAKCEETEDGFVVSPSLNAPKKYEIEGDLSGACYFFSLALLFQMKVFVRRVKLDTVQGDIKFLKLLKEKGVNFTQTNDGVLADGSGIGGFSGFTADFKDFSDQTLTAAALAPFADTPSVLKNVGHIRKQECDRIEAILKNINSLGGRAKCIGGDICVEPIPLGGGIVQCFGDHRVAMAFTIGGLKNGGVTIDDPDCCKKTFDGFFSVIGDLK